jgi:hypothetical protein
MIVQQVVSPASQLHPIVTFVSQTTIFMVLPVSLHVHQVCTLIQATTVKYVQLSALNALLYHHAVYVLLHSTLLTTNVLLPVLISFILIIMILPTYSAGVVLLDAVCAVSLINALSVILTCFCKLQLVELYNVLNSVIQVHLEILRQDFAPLVFLIATIAPQHQPVLTVKFLTFSTQ